MCQWQLMPSCGSGIGSKLLQALPGHTSGSGQWHFLEWSNGGGVKIKPAWDVGCSTCCQNIAGTHELGLLRQFQPQWTKMLASGSHDGQCGYGMRENLPQNPHAYRFGRSPLAPMDTPLRVAAVIKPCGWDVRNGICLKNPTRTYIWLCQLPSAQMVRL